MEDRPLRPFCCASPRMVAAAPMRQVASKGRARKEPLAGDVTRSGTSRRERARTPEAKEELRQRILDAAVNLFLEEGYAGFKMRELAKRLGYSATMLYMYFENKDELLFAVIGHGYELFRRHLDVPPGEPGVRLRAIGSAYLDFAFQNPSVYRLMFIDRPGFLFDLSEEKVSVRLGLLDEATRAAARVALFSKLDPEALRDVTELFWALLHGLVALALTVPLFDERWARAKLAVLTALAEPMLAK